jgi:hypothetical protein
MSFASPIAEERLKNTARFVQQSMWLLFVIAAGLLLIVRRSVPARTGSIWVLAFAVLAFMLWFALRDAVRKVGHRNTEDKLVKDVKNFLERQPVELVERRAPAAALSASPTPESFAPLNSADFVPLKGVAAYRTPVGDPVVFDAIPSRESVAVKMDFYAALMPVISNC